MKAVNIVWDVDNSEDLENLPSEINIPSGIENEDEISDYISDVTGFCHKGFDLKEWFLLKTGYPDPYYRFHKIRSFNDTMLFDCE